MLRIVFWHVQLATNSPNPATDQRCFLAVLTLIPGGKEQEPAHTRSLADEAAPLACPGDTSLARLTLLSPFTSGMSLNSAITMEKRSMNDVAKATGRVMEPTPGVPTPTAPRMWR